MNTEQEIRARFAKRYGVTSAGILTDIERRVIGGDWGANGYTTRAQADELGEHLKLSAGQRLLDIGSGRGWPGLYLSATTGCSAILLDVPADALHAGRRRAAEEGLAARTSQVIASALALPLRRDRFDAIVHSDVMC